MLQRVVKLIFIYWFRFTFFFTFSFQFKCKMTRNNVWVYIYRKILSIIYVDMCVHVCFHVFLDWLSYKVAPLYSWHFVACYEINTTPRIHNVPLPSLLLSFFTSQPVSFLIYELASVWVCKLVTTVVATRNMLIGWQE